MICSSCSLPMLGEWSRDGQTRVAWLCTACCAPQAVILTDVPDPTCPDECLPLQVLSAEASIE